MPDLQPIAEILPADMFVVHRVTKACTKCGTVWEGNAFSPEYADGAPHLAVCDRCLDLAEAATLARTPTPAPIRELQRPRKAFGYEE